MLLRCLDDGEDVFAGDEEVFLAVGLHFGTAIAIVDDFLIDGDFDLLAIADRDDAALLRALFAGGVRQEDTSRGLLFGLFRQDEHVLSERLDIRFLHMIALTD